jgi:hypothetical protein
VYTSLTDVEAAATDRLQRMGSCLHTSWALFDIVHATICGV